MRSDPVSKPRILLADSTETRCALRAAAIGEGDRAVLLAEVHNLTDAYNLTELETPSLVAISEELALTPAFAMFSTLLQCLGLPLLILGTRPFDHWQGPLMPRYATLDDRGRGKDLAETAAQLLGLLSSRTAPPGPNDQNGRFVVIGASTGGVEALISVLGQYPADCPPTLVVQHIRPDFLAGLVRRLDRVCPAQVAEARDGASMSPGLVQLAPGSERHLVIEGQSRPRCRLVHGSPVSGHRPSVDMLFRSAVPFGARTIGVLLTGMGRDGAEGLAELRKAGAWTIAQDRETSIVYGMPRAAAELGGVSEQLPLPRIGDALLSAATATPVGARHV
ncbi:chemotaxis protein CheB [Aquicoccus sp. SCR17]|nr:chemotaxis protein CheB [Carideicomes alvinocaridis]